MFNFNKKNVKKVKNY